MLKRAKKHEKWLELLSYRGYKRLQNFHES